MARVISYLRFSSSKQEMGDSKRRQLEASQNWIEKNKHTLHPLTLHDLGVSAFRGKQRSTGALGEFLNAIKDGRVKAGDILLVENLDRLSREEMSEALTLFLDILKSGVKIAVLTPYEQIYDKKSLNDIQGIILPIVAFSLAHQESQKKSYRGTKAWQEKRKRALSGEKLTRKKPGWLDIVDGQFVPNAGAKAVEYIYQATVDGIGQKALTHELVKKFKPIGYNKQHWPSSYIHKILSNRTVLGELQLYTRDENGKQVAVGEPIKGYYPRIVSDALWHRAQAAKTKRITQRGPNAKYVNLFVGLVLNARDKSLMHSRKGKTRRLQSYNYRCREKGTCPLTFDADAFERHIITALREVQPADLMLESKKTKTNRAAELQTELAQIESQLQAVQKQIEQCGSDVPALAKAAINLDSRRKLKAREINLEKEKTAVKDADPLEKAKSVIELLDKNPNDRNLRLKLRAVLTGLIDSIYMLPIKTPSRVEAQVQINFASGGVRMLAMNTQRCMVMKTNGHDTIRSGLPASIDLRTADIREMERTAKKYEKFA